MQSLKEQIQEQEESLNKIKLQYKELMSKLRKDSKEYNADYIGNVARRVMSFFFGEYAKYYEVHNFKNKFYISKSQSWSTEEKQFIDNGYFQIYRKECYGSGSVNVGFVCKKSEIMNCIYSDELIKIWIWYCKEKRFRGSFDQFLTKFKKETDSFIEIYYDYLGRKREYKHILEVINEPSIKVKNIIICITDYKN